MNLYGLRHALAGMRVIQLLLILFVYNLIKFTGGFYLYRRFKDHMLVKRVLRWVRICVLRRDRGDEERPKQHDDDLES